MLTSSIPFRIPRWLRQIRNVFAERAIALTLLLATAVLMSANIADPDLWGHIQYGWDATHFGIPATTTYSYVAVEQPWINHELLAEWTLATAFRLGGGSGLLVLKCWLGLLVMSTLMWFARREGAGWGVTALVMLVVANGLAMHWLCRPHLFSYVAFTGLLAILEWSTWSFDAGGGICADAPSPRQARFPLYILPALFALWTNAHGGFLAGMAVMTAYYGLRGVELGWREGRASLPTLTRLAMVIGASIAATMVNPYGWRFHEWLYHDLVVPRPEITEWRAPDLLSVGQWPLVVLLALWLVSVKVGGWRLGWVRGTVLLLILWQSLLHVRHTAFFVIASGFWLPPQLAAVSARLRHRYTGRFGPRWNRVARAGMTALLVATGAYSVWALSYQLRGILVERDAYPVGAMSFLAKHNLGGRMVCSFNWAQYVLAARGERGQERLAASGQFPPDSAPTRGIRVQVDGRCRTAFTQQQLDRHFDFLLGEPNPAERYRGPDSGPYDPTAVLREGDPNLVLISRLLGPSVRVMEQQDEDWCLLYQDGLAQLWGRRAIYDDPRSAEYLPPELRSLTDDPQTGYSLWPAIPR